MNTTLLFFILFLAGLSAIKYFEYFFCLACIRQGRKIISFITGASIVVIFVQILSSNFKSIQSTHELLTLILPASFILFFFIERAALKKRSEEKKWYAVDLLNSSVSVTSGLLVGIIAYSSMQTNLSQYVIFLIILVFFSLINALSFHAIHENRKPLSPKEKFLRIVSSSTPFYGALLASMIQIPMAVQVLLMSIFAGALTYVMIREIHSRERTVLPLYFLLGCFLSMGLFVINYAIATT